jgi:deazaflavin-dependent oxidoreductase (nitroreductase family)
MSVLRRAFVRAHVLVYRLTGGRLGGRWGKAPILLLTTQGRRSGRHHTNPLLYLAHGRGFAVVATNDGARRHPAWYFNVRAHPTAHVQVAAASFAVDGRTAGGAERAELWPRLVSMYRNYERDQQRARRELPVVLLERRTA